MALLTSRGIGLVAATALLVAGTAVDHARAQTSNTAQQADSKQKSPEKKDAAKQTQSQTQTNSGKSAPMSGFRPDPQTNY